jgi:predicted AAA+ superfamily ATPase
MYAYQTGKPDAKNDFIARRAGETAYYQVCYLLAGNETIEREFAPLLAIQDNYPKFVLSLDTFDLSRKGITHKNIRDWLLEK